MNVFVLVTQLCLTICNPIDSAACSVPLFMEFSRQEYWSDCRILLQEIFPTQGLNLGLLHYRQILYPLSHQGSPNSDISMLNFLSIITLFWLWRRMFLFSEDSILGI